MTQGAVIARIISQYSDKGTKAALKDLKGMEKHFAEFGHKVKQAFEVAGVAAAAFAVKIGTDAVKAAIADQQSQALLAHALKNTTGATNTQIAAVEEHIKKQMLLLGVSDNELRPSMVALSAATHDITKAQNLQSLALDISAGRGKDLQAVSLALSKAYLGNFTALRRMGIPISENIIKTKDFNGLVKELTASVGGQAAVAANTFAGRMNRIGLSFEEAKKSLGYALLPVLEKLATLLTDKVIPKIQAWVDLNKDKLAQSFSNATTAIVHMLTAAFNVAKWFASHMTVVKELAVIYASLWAAKKVYIFVSALTKIITAFKAIKAAAETAAVFEALATGGASLAAASAALVIAGLGTAYVTMGNQGVDAFNKINAAQSRNKYHSFNARDPLGGFRTTPESFTDSTTVATGAYNKMNKVILKNNADLKASQALQKLIAAQAAADAKAAAKDAAAKLATEKALAILKKMGVTPTNETNPIELEAARQNLVKQGNLELQHQLDLMTQRLTLQDALTVSAQKYTDILQALSDGKITTQEVEVLAAKWGVTKDAVISYIEKLFGLADFQASLASTVQPGDLAADAWKRALAALNAYLSTHVTSAGLPIAQSVNPVTGASSSSTLATISGAGASGGNSPTSMGLTSFLADAQAKRDAAAAASMASGYGQSSSPTSMGLGSFLAGSQSSPNTNGVTVNVTVQGSVTTANDLAANVRQHLQDLQLSGKPLTVGALSL